MAPRITRQIFKAEAFSTLSRMFRIRILIGMFSRSQVEPALAILCACLMTLRPLFVDLKLNLSKLSTRFSRSKGQSLSEASSSTYISKEGDLHLQWPGTQTRHEDSPSLGHERMDTKRGLRIVTVDQGMTVRKDPYLQV